MKNPIVLQIIFLKISNYDNKLKITSSWDCSNEVEQGDRKNEQVRHKDWKCLSYFNWKLPTIRNCSKVMCIILNCL